MALPTVNSNGPEWLSASEAAAALGISPKTVWRRARTGELTARKVPSGRGGEVWEIALKTPTDRPAKPNGQNRPTDRPNIAPEVIGEREPTGQTERTPTDRPAKPSGQKHDAKGEVETATGARFMAHLEEENKFLRAALEQRDRDAAELRAALRAALKLTAGVSAPMLTTGTPEPPEREQIATTDKVPRVTPASPQRSAKRDSATDWNSIYSQIADELEAQEKN